MGVHACMHLAGREATGGFSGGLGCTCIAGLVDLRCGGRCAAVPSAQAMRQPAAAPLYDVSD